MTWREGVEYWRAWARRTDGDIVDDAPRLAAFYDEMVKHCRQLDDDMPDEICQRLEMSAP